MFRAYCKKFMTMAIFISANTAAFTATAASGSTPRKELVDGKCPDHQTVPDYISEKNYFFSHEQVPTATH